ncbi:MAG: hypothetical protein WC712_12330 [Candidatus Brocadiia bacterium]
MSRRKEAAMVRERFVGEGQHFVGETWKHEPMDASSNDREAEAGSLAGRQESEDSDFFFFPLLFLGHASSFPGHFAFIRG